MGGARFIGDTTMTTQLSLIDNLDVGFQNERDNRIIVEALAIIDRRMYTRGEAMTCPETVKDYLKLHIAQNEHEVFGVVFLDSKHRAIAFEVLFYGSIDGASVYPRQVVKRGLAHNAAAAILTHNHPSGELEPSHADRVLTERLKTALALVEIRVLDHFIIGAGQPLSLAEQGLI